MWNFNIKFIVVFKNELWIILIRILILLEILDFFDFKYF